MSRRDTSYTERNGLGENVRHVQHATPSAAYRREVNAWYAVWRNLSDRQKDAWRALSKEQQEQTKELTGEQFAEVMQ